MCHAVIYFPLCLLIHSNGKNQFTMDRIGASPHLIWLKAAKIKLEHQVSWTIKNNPEVPNVPMNTSSLLQMCTCYAALMSQWFHCVTYNIYIYNFFKMSFGLIDPVLFSKSSSSFHHQQHNILHTLHILQNDPRHYPEASHSLFHIWSSTTFGFGKTSFVKVDFLIVTECLSLTKLNWSWIVNGFLRMLEHGRKGLLSMSPFHSSHFYCHSSSQHASMPACQHAQYGQPRWSRVRSHCSYPASPKSPDDLQLQSYIHIIQHNKKLWSQVYVSLISCTGEMSFYYNHRHISD